MAGAWLLWTVDVLEAVAKLALKKRSNQDIEREARGYLGGYGGMPPRKILIQFGGCCWV